MFRDGRSRRYILAFASVLRSDSPHAFAARGPFAASITAPQPADIPHGIDSPVGRISVLDGQVLLLGIGHTANTTIHLAEYMSGAVQAQEISSYSERWPASTPGLC